jgi:hypothetical protein
MKAVVLDEAEKLDIPLDVHEIGDTESLAQLNPLSLPRLYIQGSLIASKSPPKPEEIRFGCYGCRDATDLAASETVLGFPGNRLLNVMQHLEYLAQKAMPASRSKKAWSALEKQAARSVVQETE